MTKKPSKPIKNAQIEQQEKPHIKNNDSQNLELLSEEKKELAIILSRFYSGPIPHPSILKQYEDFLPGSAQRIIKMAEKQTAHRHKIEEKSLDYSHAEITKGQYLGFFISCFALASGTLCSLLGAILPGSLFGTAGVAGLAAVFVYGSKKREKSFKEQTKD